MNGMSKEVIRTEEAPIPRGPYSQAIRAGQYVFVAGQGPFEPKTSKMVEGGIEEQTRQTLENVKSILSAAGLSLEDVVKVSVFLKDAKDFPKMNEVYRTYFTAEQPARTTVEADMVVDGMLVEVDAIAHEA